MRLRLVTLVICLTAVGFARSWSGYLVDAPCWHNAENNVSQDATSTGSRDMGIALRQCLATSETKDFAIVLSDWTSLKLDGVGAEKAAGIVSSIRKQSMLNCVVVKGALQKHTILAGSVSSAWVRPYR
jgi:hypothetical protein